MRRTNFLEARRAYPGRLAAVVWLLTVALFGASVWIFLEARDLKATADKFGVHAIQLGSDLSVMATDDVAVPTEAAFSELVGRIERLNALTGERHTSLLVLLAALEGALPEKVWITQMTYSVESGAFGVSLLGETETDLPLALQRIEAISELRDVILERQLRVQTGARNMLQFDIRAVAE